MKLINQQGSLGNKGFFKNFICLINVHDDCFCSSEKLSCRTVLTFRKSSYNGYKVIVVINKNQDIKVLNCG